MVIRTTKERSDVSLRRDLRRVFVFLGAVQRRATARRRSSQIENRKCVAAQPFNNAINITMNKITPRITNTKHPIFSQLYGRSPWTSPVRPLTTI